MNLRCDCISCKYEKQKPTEDPCYRCYNDSEYVYDGKEYNNYPQSTDKDYVKTLHEYIEREAAINELTEENLMANLDSVMDGLSKQIKRSAHRILASLPAADVRPVRHGRWIKDDETGEPICSICYSGKPTKAVSSPVIEHKLNDYEIRYCYYCGAKMDKNNNIGD